LSNAYILANAQASPVRQAIVEARKLRWPTPRVVVADLMAVISDPASLPAAELQRAAVNATQAAIGMWLVEDLPASFTPRISCYRDFIDFVRSCVSTSLGLGA
jgi:hypothetical protein